MDQNLIGTNWSSVNGTLFQIDKFEIDNDIVVVYYHQTNDKNLKFHCNFDAFQERYVQTLQQDYRLLAKNKTGLIL